MQFGIPGNRTFKGFTLIELLVVLAIIALMLGVALPRYFHSVDRAKEATLRHDLSVMRETIDKFHGDFNRYPDSLEELVQRRYLRSVPADPITGSNRTWVVSSPSGQDFRGVYDVRSSAPGVAADGSRYVDW